jgi:hypothetical protein
VKLCEVASVIKSANAGASQITIDVVFADPETYEKVISAGCPDPAALAALYRVGARDVVVHHYSPANTIKITIPRAVVSGGMDERDFDGVQQYVPLLDLEVDVDAR